jgi:hypothetical protein
VRKYSIETSLCIEVSEGLNVTTGSVTVELYTVIEEPDGK